MRYVQVVQVLYGRSDLLEYLPGFALGQGAFVADVLEQVSVAAVLHEDVNVFAELDSLKNGHDVRVRDVSDDAQLPGQEFRRERIIRVFLIDNLAGEFNQFAAKFYVSQIDLAVRSLADHVLQAVLFRTKV